MSVVVVLHWSVRYVVQVATSVKCSASRLGRQVLNFAQKADALLAQVPPLVSELPSEPVLVVLSEPVAASVVAFPSLFDAVSPATEESDELFLLELQAAEKASRLPKITAHFVI